jgi:hypothetical protein
MAAGGRTQAAFENSNDIRTSRLCHIAATTQSEARDEALQSIFTLGASAGSSSLCLLLLATHQACCVAATLEDGNYA